MPEVYLQTLFSGAPHAEGDGGRIAASSFPFVIGRHRSSDLPIPNASVSRRHCRLFLREGRLWVDDLGSLNGTFVNEEPVRTARALNDGDVLRLAYVVFRVHAPSDDATIVDAGDVRPRRGRQVLVVEDDDNSAQLLAVLLRAWGHDVRVAHDGPEALRSARDNPPDAVLLDVRLPGMDGYEVARRLRRETGLKDARLVAMTGCPDAVADDPTESAVQELLIKPVAPETLRELIGRS